MRSLMSSPWMTTSYRCCQCCWTYHWNCGCRPETQNKVATDLLCRHFHPTQSLIAVTYHVSFSYSWPLQLQRTTGFIKHARKYRSKMRLWRIACYFCDFCHPVNCFDTFSTCLLIVIKLFKLICCKSFNALISNLINSTCSRACCMISAFDFAVFAL